MSSIEINNTAFYRGEFNDRRREFSEACSWLSEEMGLPYKGTRMGEYERLLKTFINPEATPIGEDALLDDFYLFMQATTEAYQIIRLWKTFKLSEHQGLKERIKHVMSGKSMRAEAIKKNKRGQNNDPARDFAFELNIASRFLKGGYDVDLTDVCDVVVKIDKSKLYVECKRIKSLNKLGDRIKKASVQIDKKIGADRKNKFGMIALDVTDLILPTGSVAISGSVKMYNLHVQSQITDFAKKHGHICDKNIGRNVVGTFYEYSSSAFFTDENKDISLGHARAACMYRRSNQSRKSLRFVTDFMAKIANQNL